MKAGNSQGKPRPIRESVQEYARGVVGGLLFSLPLLYTMELWWTGFLVHPHHLILYMGVTFLLLLGYNRYAGMRKDATWFEVGIDSIEEMGLGLLIAALVLFLLGRLDAGMPPREIVGKIVVAAMTVAVGVSVGKAQLGNGGESGSEAGDHTNSTGNQDLPDTAAQLVLGFCGAILIAANVAPTEEIVLIGAESSTGRLLGLAALSILLGALTLFESEFIGSAKHVRRDGVFWMAFGVVTSYAAALLASALMLWFFGRFDGVSPVVALSETIVLAFPAMLGASAGRLLIQ